MADLRRVVDRIMRDYGHNVLLRRRIADSNGGLYPQAQYANRGGKPLYEKHTVRHMHPSSVALAGTTQQQMEGVVTNIDRVYWFRWDVNPTEGDLIVDHKPVGMGANARTDWEHFTIDYAQPMRGNGGRIEYWACGASRTDE